MKVTNRTSLVSWTKKTDSFNDHPASNCLLTVWRNNPGKAYFKVNTPLKHRVNPLWLKFSRYTSFTCDFTHSTSVSTNFSDARMLKVPKFKISGNCTDGRTRGFSSPGTQQTTSKIHAMVRWNWYDSPWVH